jgi:hypothetical protein
MFVMSHSVAFELPALGAVIAMIIIRTPKKFTAERLPVTQPRS